MAKNVNWINAVFAGKQLTNNRLAEKLDKGAEPSANEAPT